MKHLYFLVILLLLSNTTTIFAQDVIYLARGKQEKGIVTKITEDKVKYKTENSSGSVKSISIKDVVLLFNIYGDFLHFKGNAKMFTDNEADDFINKPAVRNNDLIILKSDGKILAVKMLLEKDDSTTVVYNGKERKLGTNTIAAIIHQKGPHQLFVAPENAALYLEKDSINKYAQLPAEVLKIAKPIILPPVVTPPVVTPPVAVAPVVVAVKKDSTKAPSSSLPDFKSYQDKATQKVKDFNTDINIIISPNSDRGKVDNTIDLACGLFVKDAKIEISKINRIKKPKYLIKDYLNNLYLMSKSVDKVEIAYADITYASDWKPGADGNYYAVITYVQKYQATKDGQIVYGDITERKVSIILKHYQKATESGNKTDWEVFLGDIGVVETERMNSPKG